MTDKLLEAARAKLRASKATAGVAPKAADAALVEKARLKLQAAKQQKTSPQAGSSPIPLPRAKGDTRPVEPVVGASAVAETAQAPAPRDLSSDDSGVLPTVKKAFGFAKKLNPASVITDTAATLGKAFYDAGTTPLEKSYQTAKRDLEAGKALVGAGDPAAFVEEQKQLDAIKYDADLEQRVRGYSAAEGFSGKLQYLYNNPDVFAAIMGEQTGNAVVSTGAGAAGAIAGSVVPVVGTATGLTAGVMVGSGASAAAQAVTQYMDDKGIDPTNEDQVRGLFMNPAAMSDMRSYAAKYGVAVGAFDALAAMLGAKGAGAMLAKPFVRAAGQEAVGPIAEGAGNLAISAATSGVGETSGGYLSRGEVNMSDVADEVIFGVASDLGTSTISTLVARGERDSRAPTPDEIAAAGGQPPEQIATPDQAEAEGRTLYGWVEDPSNATPIELGDYNAAEKKAGAGDIRRGTIIAVKPEEAKRESATSVEEVVGKAAEHLRATSGSPTVARGVIGTVASQLKLTSEQFKPLKSALEAHEQRVQLGVDPQESLTTLLEDLPVALENVQAPIVRQTYTGPIVGKKVSPRVENSIPFLRAELTTNNGVALTAGPAEKAQTRQIDGNKLQAALKERGWTIVPSGIKRIVVAAPRMEKLLDQTFTFTTPEARQRFIEGDLEERTTLMKSGDVAWAGRLDGRFIVSSLSADINGQAIRLLKENGDVVDSLDAKEFLEKLASPSQLKTDAMDQKWLYPQRNIADSVRSAALESEWKIQLPNSGDMMIASLTPRFKQFSDLFKKWHKQFNTKKPTLFVEAVRSATGFTLPDSLRLSLPQTFPVLEAEINTGGYNGFAWDLGEYGRVVVLVTEDQSSPWNYRSDADIYGTFTHEMGHVISSEHFSSAPLETRNKIFAAYRRFVLANPLTQTQYDQFRRRRFAKAKQNTQFDFVSRKADYYLRFEEWFAEQTARWGDTNRRPLGVLGKFFRKLAQEIIRLYKEASGTRLENKLNRRAENETEQFLSSIWDGQDVLTNWPENAVSYTEAQGRKLNSKVDPDPLAQHGSTSNVSAALKSVEGQPFLSSAQRSLLASVRAGVDRYNWFYEWALNLRQLAARNPHIRELQLVNEIFDFAKNDATKIMVEAEGYLKRWRKRSEKQRNALTDLLYEMDQMSYLKPDEAPRWPSPAEFADMVKRLGLDADTLALYRDIRDFFLNSVRRQEELQIQEAERITDPALKAAAIKSAQDMSRGLISRPYFPQMRFGKWSLTIKQQSGKLEHFELFESKRELQTALDAAVKQYPASEGWQVEGSTVPQEMQPFMGVPPWMIDKLRDMPGLSKNQQDWLESFRYMLAPAQSFRKRMLKRKKYAGYSTDGRRVFASYSFHHAKFYSRIKHDWDLRQAIDSLRHSRNEALAPNEISDRKRMADFVERIYKEFRNPSQDWAALRVLNAIWHLGFVPASAAVNLTQTVLATAPYLSAKFGTVKGEAALMDAARKLSTFYKKGSYGGQSDIEFKAIAKAIEEGFIDESMAAELAASAVGSGAGLRVGNSFFKEKLSTGWQQFSEKAMWMFRMAEQWNRRVSFRAARQLAFDNPNTPWVQDMRIKHFLKYDQLVKSGWTDREAIAYLAGIETLLETHFSYDKLARPRFMQGRKSVLFAFYMFTQNSLFMLWNNKDMLARYMLYTAMIAGPMGLVPDDLEDVLNAIASKLFGKDFNLEREARKLIVDLLGDDSHVPPDLLLHGASRYTFGLSLAGDVLGAKFVPDIDMSQSMSINRVLPLNVSSLVKPAADWNERVANVTRDAAGAAYGIPLAITKAIAGSDLNLTDFKRWEGAMPRAFRQATRAGRLAIEGAERTNSGAKTIQFDTEDPKQLGELLAIAAGFTPTRQSQYWDRQTAQKEMDLFWDAQRKMLFEELYHSRFTYQDPEAFREGIEKVRLFNQRAPKGYQITQQNIKQSLDRRQKMRMKLEGGDNPYVKPGVADEASRLYPEGEITSQKPVR